MTKGFTLTEMIAVIAIIGLVLLISIPVTQNMMKSNREQQFMTYVESVEKALKTYADIRMANNTEKTGANGVSIEDLVSIGYIKEFKVEDFVVVNKSFDLKKEDSGKVIINSGSVLTLKFKKGSTKVCCSKETCTTC